MTKVGVADLPGSYEFIIDDHSVLMIHGSRPIMVVAFACAVEGYGWQNRLRNMDVEAICLKDTSYNWYMNGSDNTSSEQEMLDIVKTHIDRAGRPRLGVLGQSAGGYAALKYGLALGADVICAFGPQTHFIDETGLQGSLLKVPPALLDIRSSLLSRSTHCGHAHIFVSRSEASNPPESFLWDDHAHLSGLESAPDLSIHVVEYDRHPVAVHLSRTGRLQAVLEQVFGLQDHGLDLNSL